MGRFRAAAVTLLCVLSVSACSPGVPETGKVVTVDTIDTARDRAEVTQGLSPPRPGSPPVVIATGFMRAMSSADPTRASSWVVDEPAVKATVRGWLDATEVHVYDQFTVDETVPDAKQTSVAVLVSRQGTLTGGRTWRPEAGDAEFILQLRKDKQEWRVANPPANPWMRSSDFEQRFARLSVYLLAPDGRHLTPVPTFSRIPLSVPPPAAQQPSADATADLARAAVELVLRGPAGLGVAALHSAIPPGTRLNSVRLVDGVAQIDLSAPFASPGGLPGRLRVGQIVLTVTRLINIPEVAITVDGKPIGAVGPDRFDASGSWRANAQPLAELVSGRGGSPTDILFVRNGQLFRVPYRRGEQGVEVVPFPPAGTMSAPTWSPSGTGVAFLVRNQGRTRLWLGSADGRDAAPTQLEGELSDPSYTPDGSRLLVLRRDKGRVALWSVSAVTGAAVALRLPELPGRLEPSLVRVSPSGAFVLALGARPGQRFGAGGQLYLGQLGDTGILSWTPSPIAPGHAAVLSPVWLNPGMLAFIAKNNNQGDPGALWITALDGWQPERMALDDEEGIELGDRLTTNPAGDVFVFTVRSPTGTSQLLTVRRRDTRLLTPLTRPDQDASDSDPSFASH